MERTIEDILVKLIVLDDYSQLFKEMIDNQSVEMNKFIGCAMNHLEQMENPMKIEQMAGFIGRLCYENQSLKCINDQINSLDNDEENPLKRKFIKMVLKETGIKRFFPIFTIHTY